MKPLVNSADPRVLTDNPNLYIINNQEVRNIYSIYLTHDIGRGRHYRDLYNILREASEVDTFLIYLNNYGGYVCTGQDIINAMRMCRGRVYTVLSGPVYSMAPLIALAGHKVFVEQDVFMMFHDYSGGSRGKGHEMQSQIKHEKPHFDNMFKGIVKGFLKEEETSKVLAGKDLYLGRKEIITRLKRMKKLGNQDKTL